MREFEQRGILFWAILGLVTFYILSLFPDIDLWIEIAISIIPFLLKLIFSFLHDYFFIIPEEKYNEKEKEIKELENSFISPNIEFKVLSLAEAIKHDGYRYASIVVINHAELDIDNFCAVITSFEKQRITREEVSFMDEKNRSHVVGFDKAKWKNETSFVNPGGKPVENEKNKEKISIGYKGGTARFNLIKGNGENEIIVLNQGSPYSITFGKEFKITLRFTGYLKEKPILSIYKIYRLSCSYKDDIKRKGIRLIDFKEYDENEEEF